MQVDQSTTSTIVFLLVEQQDMYTPVDVSSVVPEVWISKNSNGFAKLEGRTSPIGAGWYGLELRPSETNTAGPLIVRAFAPGTAEWRDIVQVVTPANATPGEGGGGGGSVQPEPKVNFVQNGDFSEGTRQWIFYTNGSGSWNVAQGSAKVSVVRPNTNTQLYQKEIVLMPGSYTLQFDARSDRAKQMGVYLHQHLPPRNNLGVAERVSLSTNWQTFTYSFTVAAREENARLRFWFVDGVKNNDDFSIRNVSITAAA